MAEPSAPIRIVRGNPTDDELAAVVVCLFALATASQPAPGSVRHTGWAAREAGLGAPLRPGPGAWRGSSRLR